MDTLPFVIFLDMILALCTLLICWFACQLFQYLFGCKDKRYRSISWKLQIPTIIFHLSAISAIVIIYTAIIINQTNSNTSQNTLLLDSTVIGLLLQSLSNFCFIFVFLIRLQYSYNHWSQKNYHQHN